MRNISSGRLALALALVSLLGCRGAADLVRARAASDLSCDEAMLTVVEVGEEGDGTIYGANGCGHAARYRCALDDVGPHSGPGTSMASASMQQMPRREVTCKPLQDSGSAP